MAYWDDVKERWRDMTGAPERQQDPAPRASQIASLELTVVVESRPGESFPVFIDGGYMGKTGESYEIPPGNYEITVVIDDQPQVKAFSLSAGGRKVAYF
jgi:hypothetical protein